MFNLNATHVRVLEDFAALPESAHKDDWKPLLQLLSLPVGHLESVQAVLRQGRWREANDPVGYIRSAARRENRKLDRPRRPRALVGCISELKLPRNEDGTFMDHDEAIDLLQTVPQDWGCLTPFAKQRVHRRFLIADSPYEDAEYSIDYSKVMDEVTPIAGLSNTRRDAIQKVLELRATAHISREQILSYPVEGARKRLQAAMKWVERNMALLAKVMSSRP
jgi:hypothetical protein